MGIRNVDIILFSRWLTVRFLANGTPISPLKLQKLLYYCQAWHLVVFDGHPLFDEEPRAWSNGPVYPSVYHTYKNQFWRHQPIVFNDNGNSLDLDKKNAELVAQMGLSEDQWILLEKVLLKYGSYTKEKLVLLTHSELPWNDARGDCGPFDTCNDPIPHDSMKEYYASLLTNAS